MTAAREALHRWALIATFVLTMTVAAVGHIRGGKHRRKAWKRMRRQVEAWPW